MTVIFPIETQDQRAIVACGIVFSFLPAIVVGLRVLARRKANRLLDTSDYLIITSGVLVVIYQGVAISSVLAGGVGFHVNDIEDRFGVKPGTTLFLKHLIAIQVLWAVTLGLCRISIIHLFTKIFVVQSFIVVARATYVLIILWALAAILSAFLLCQPFEFNWDKTIEGGVCGNPMVSWIVTGVLNMISDLIILIMPMPYLLGLELAWPKRLVLAATFGIGILTCVVSIVRVVIMTQIDFNDITYTIPHTVLFSALEPCVAVTLACVIILRPLFGGQYSPDGTATFASPSADALSRNVSNRHFKQLNDDSSETRLRPEEVGYRATVAKSPEPFKGFGSLGDVGLEMGSISIKHEWTVEEEPRPRTASGQKDQS
ncbi:hypothetical protein F4821DRAFT_259218 [Hypoxylon rubiginosum]|uniref:Uncharacterized protein n=1 Tax=Hypoxylon rubiginosum TaxID=110542 RepID=A0ACC0D3E9_9PEZI|nr:hypothetical protein F4821DRAFT_259218 [Hypoxylon rubiginosum]